MQEELVSIIIPIFNAEKYISHCLDSIVQQTYRNIEIILVDDGSTDKTIDICRMRAESEDRIRIIHQENKGVSDARNTGILNSRGSLLAMVDSDDYVAPNMIEVLYTSYCKTKSDIIICDFVDGCDLGYIFSEEEPVSYYTADFETTMQKAYANGHNALRFIAPWGKLYSRKLFEGVVYPEGKIFEDIYTTHILLNKSNAITVVDQCLLYYYIHEDSIMHKPFHLGKLDYLDALKNRIAYFRDNSYPELEKIAYEEYLHSLVWEYSRVRDILHDDSAKKEIIHRFREVYIKDYASKRYPQETKVFLKVFNMNPEMIVLYWRIAAKLKGIGEKMQ